MLCYIILYYIKIIYLTTEFFHMESHGGQIDHRTHISKIENSKGATPFIGDTLP